MRIFTIACVAICLILALGVFNALMVSFIGVPVWTTYVASGLVGWFIIAPTCEIVWKRMKPPAVE